MTINCGRCGKPMYKPGIAVCDGCKKMMTKNKDRSERRMEKTIMQEKTLYENAVRPGREEEKDDYARDHYVDTHDASAVWVSEDSKKGRGRRH